MNVFRYSDDGFYSHFTTIKLLEFLENKSEYVSLGEILEKFKYTIIDKEKLEAILHPLLTKGLINTDYYERSGLHLATAVAISNLGKYYLSDLIHDWRYLFYVSVDTIISDRDTLKKMKLKYESAIRAEHVPSKITRKKDLIELFLGYLQQEEVKEKEYLQYYNVGQKSIIEKIKQGYLHSVSEFEKIVHLKMKLTEVLMVLCYSK